MNWRLWLGVGISALFLLFVFRKVNLYELKGALETANYIYLIPVVLLLILSLWLRAFRWHYILQPIKKIKIGSLFSATMIGFMANNLLPARLGEFVRAYVIGQKEQISKSSSFATIVVERVFDGLTLLLFLVVVLIFGSFSSPKWLRNTAYIALGVYLFTLFFLILLKIKTNETLRLAEFIFRPFPPKLRRKFIQALNSFARGLKILHDTKNIVVSVVLSLFIWLPVAAIIYFLLVSFGIHLPIYASFLLMVILCLGVMVPSAPGYVGTIQFFCVAGLALFGVPKSQALSFSIIYHVSTFIPVTAIGLVYLFVERLSFAEIQGSTKIKKEKVV